MRVVIVEDDQLIRRGLVKMLTDQKVKIEVVGEAEDGKEGLSLLEKITPDVCFVDIQMPVMDGLAFIKEAKEKNKSIRMVVISAFANFSYAQRAMELGCVAYLLKPIDLDELADLLQRLDVMIHSNENEKVSHSLSDASVQENEKYIIRMAKQYIAAYYHRDIPLDEIAAHVGIKASYFSHLFKRHTKMTFVDYLTRIRIEHAKELLKKANNRVYQVGEQVGIPNSQYFSKLFKRIVGVTPVEYRQKYLGNK